MIKIPLTPRQTETAEWLLSCPLFDEDAASLAHNWDETPERAAVIVAAASTAKLIGRVLHLPENPDVLQYVHGDAERLASMSAHEYLDEMLGKGISHRDAICKSNAVVRSIESLAGKIAAHLPPK